MQLRLYNLIPQTLPLLLCGWLAKLQTVVKKNEEVNRCILGVVVKKRPKTQAKIKEGCD